MALHAPVQTLWQSLAWAGAAACNRSVPLARRRACCLLAETRCGASAAWQPWRMSLLRRRCRHAAPALHALTGARRRAENPARVHAPRLGRPGCAELYGLPIHVAVLPAAAVRARHAAHVQRHHPQRPGPGGRATAPARVNRGAARVPLHCALAWLCSRGGNACPQHPCEHSSLHCFLGFVTGQPACCLTSEHTLCSSSPVKHTRQQLIDLMPAPAHIWHAPGTAAHWLERARRLLLWWIVPRR